MLAAASLIPGAKVFGTGGTDRAREFIRYLGLDAKLSPGAIPQAGMPRALARMHVNLYVTMSECAPMLPLESLAAGAPCLLGPTSHYFEDEPWLHSHLVVPSPDRAEVIAEYIRRALEARDEIIAAYRRYAPGYNARAHASVRAFLDLPPAPGTAGAPHG